ncbi:MAG: hypothetical protein IKC71_02090 [Clostridia bacterium]|nr:hypothetical protein [Clostridia bacterium]
MKKTLKRNIIVSAILTIMLCVSLVAGATYALFTSESKVNIAVTSGKVEVVADISDTEYKSLDTNWTAFNDNATFSVGGTVAIANGDVTLTNIVPGDGIKFNVNVQNNSSVMVKYRTLIQNTANSDATLFDALEVTVDNTEYKGKTATPWAKLNPGTDGETVAVSVIFPEGVSGVEYMEKTCGFTILVQAVQGNADTVDEVFAKEEVVVDATNMTVEDKTVGSVDGTKAEVPTGTKLVDGETTLSLNVTEADANVGNFQFGEDAVALNIDIPEVADDNTGVILVTLKGYFPDKPVSVTLFHEGVLMTPVASVNEVDSADEYYYDAKTGDIVLATDNFSNFTAVANVKVVTTGNELYDVAFNQMNKYKNVHNVILANDIILEKGINVKNDVVVDLNGYTLTNNCTSEAFLTYASLTVKNGEIAVGTKTAVKAYADVTLEDVKLSTADDVVFGTRLLVTQGGCGALVLNNVEIDIAKFKVNASALIDNNAGTLITLNEVSLDMVLDTTYTAYFIYRSADNVTMTNCDFYIVDATGYEYDVVRKTDSALADKFGFEKNDNVQFVATVKELTDAVKTAEKVVLTDNIAITSSVQVRKDIIIDLNGYTLTNNGSSEAFLTYAPLTIKNGEIAVGTKTAVKAYADVALEDVKLSTADDVVFGTRLLVTQGGCDALVLNKVEIDIAKFKVNGGALIDNNAGTLITLNEVSLDMVLDTTYTAYFIYRSADNVTMTNCTFNITDAEDAVYDVVRKTDSALADKFGFEKK